MLLSAESSNFSHDDLRLISWEEHRLVREDGFCDPKPCLFVERSVLLNDLDVVPIFSFDRLRKGLLIRHRLYNEDNSRTIHGERLVECDDRVTCFVEVESLVDEVLEYESFPAVPLAVFLVQDRNDCRVIGIVVLGYGEVYADNNEPLVEIAVAILRAGR